MTVSRLIARPMLSSMFVVGGLHSVRNARALAPAAEPVTDKVVPLVKRTGLPIPEDPATLVRINGAVQLVAGLALATGHAPRLSAAALGLSLAPTTFAGHRFWESGSAGDKSQHKIHFFKNVSMMGGLIIAAGDTNGKPGVAWRARRVAKDAKREARHLAATTRREAKLVRAKV